MWTVAINWHLILGFVVFTPVSFIIVTLIENALGVNERLKDLPTWKRGLSATATFVQGALFYALFLAK